MKSVVAQYFSADPDPYRCDNVNTVADVWQALGRSKEEWHDKDIIAVANGEVVTLSQELEQDSYVCFYAKGKYG